MAQSDDFYRELATRESSNNPRAIEKRHGNHYGLYQMGKKALHDVKYYDVDKGEWTGRDGINSLDDFLGNVDVQHKAIREYHNLIYKRKGFEQFEGKEINGVLLTKSGMVAAAHLVGDSKFRTFLDEGGIGETPKDENHTSCMEYLTKFSGKTVTSSHSAEAEAVEIKPEGIDYSIEPHLEKADQVSGLDKETIRSEYLLGFKKVVKNLSQADLKDKKAAVELAKKYYQYLDDHGVSYGKLALEVVENKGDYGEYANRHMNAQSIFEGIPEHKLPEMRQNLIISLAYRDADMRADKDFIISDKAVKRIEEYHIDEFGKHSTPYAWGGLLMKELLGSGSWLEFYEESGGFTKKSFYGGLKLAKAQATGYDGEFSSARMLQAASHAYLHKPVGSFNIACIADSRESAAQRLKVDISQLEELNEVDLGMESPMVRTKAFVVRSAKPQPQASKDQGEAVAVKADITSYLLEGTKHKVVTSSSKEELMSSQKISPTHVIPLERDGKNNKFVVIEDAPEIVSQMMSERTKELLATHSDKISVSAAILLFERDEAEAIANAFCSALYALGQGSFNAAIVSAAIPAKNFCNHYVVSIQPPGINILQIKLKGANK